MDLLETALRSRNKTVFSSVWDLLRSHAASMRAFSPAAACDGERARAMTLQACDLRVDLAKHLVQKESLALLRRLAEASGWTAWRDAMFAGAAINLSERRKVLHTALRRPVSSPLQVDGVDVVAAVEKVRTQVRAFADRIHSGEARGCGGETFTDVVNIGIGGSDLGPRLVCDALDHLAPDNAPRVHFVANVDPSDLERTLGPLDARRTLFLVASKTFTTLETMQNARAAREWWLQSTQKPEGLSKHFVALSSNAVEVQRFGIDVDRAMFTFWDWVGGRFSLWSSIGLSIALRLGAQRFDELLAGAHSMDRHFAEAPAERNAPLLLALIDLWYRNFWGVQSRAVIPYAQALRFLPAYLQQLEMESNGKSVTRQGNKCPYDTSAVVWGEPGTNGQHAFFQQLHQGPQFVPCDFLIAAKPTSGSQEQHNLLAANCFAQSRALMLGGRNGELTSGRPGQAATHAAADARLSARHFPGSRPSTTILFAELDARSLGQILALYEHKVFCLGALWDINSFDQWGVELGKKVAQSLSESVAQADSPLVEADASTRLLIEQFHALRDSAVP